MFKGFVLSESLNNPTILNDFRKIYVNVEDHPESEEERFWHLFKIEIKDEEIEDALDTLSKDIKPGWYAHFWDDETVCVVFLNKVFRLQRDGMEDSEKLHEVREYGVRSGIGEEYLDFWLED